MSTEDPAVRMWRETLDARVQDVAEKHLAGCQEYLFWSEDPWDDGENPPEDPAFAPFCGCDTCVVREVLTAAWTYVWQSDPSRAEDVRRLLQKEWDR